MLSSRSPFELAEELVSVWGGRRGTDSLRKGNAGCSGEAFDGARDRAGEISSISLGMMRSGLLLRLEEAGIAGWNKTKDEDPAEGLLWLRLTISCTVSSDFLNGEFGGVSELLFVITTSKRLDLLFFLLRLFCLRKYFWAWLATWVGVLVITKFLEIPLQSPFPSFSNPAKNVRCSSSVHGTPRFLSWPSLLLDDCGSPPSERYP